MDAGGPPLKRHKVSIDGKLNVDCDDSDGEPNIIHSQDIDNNKKAKVKSGKKEDQEEEEEELSSHDDDGIACSTDLLVDDGNQAPNQVAIMPSTSKEVFMCQCSYLDLFTL